MRLSATSNEFREWRNLRRRLKNPKSPDFGVEFHADWETYKKFAEDNPAPGHVWSISGISFERIDPAKGYVPGNVHWVLSKDIQDLIELNRRTTEKNKMSGFKA